MQSNILYRNNSAIQRKTKEIIISVTMLSNDNKYK